MTISDGSFESKNPKRRVYKQIPPEKRDALLRAVVEEQRTIKDAAIRVGVKYSAAKSIVKIFRDTGRANKLTKKRPIINVIQVQASSQNQMEQNYLVEQSQFCWGNPATDFAGQE